ncbi:MAG: tetratricopeptide repeat protein [Bernardetiaceae bacterium]|nr:tetratricopeptide repeat protein [Bernardetiaceae bacterium]
MPIFLFRFWILILILLSALSSCDFLRERAPNEVAPFPYVFSEEALQTQIRFITQTIRNEGETPDYYYRRAILYLKNKQENLAYEDIKNALKSDSTQGVYYFVLAQALIIREEPLPALEALENAYRLGYQNTELHSLTGILAAEQQKPEIALKHLNMALDVLPEEADFLYYKGEAYRQLQDTAKAAHFLRKTIALDSSYEKAYITAMQLYRHLESPKTTLYYGDIALAKIGEVPTVLLEIAAAYTDMYKTQTAMAWYRKTLEVDTTVWQANYALGDYLFRKEYYTEARDLFERVLRYNDNLPDVYYNLAFMYEYKIAYQKGANKLKSFNKAVDYYNKAIALLPENQYIPQALANCQKKLEYEEYKNSPQYLIDMMERVKRRKEAQADSLKRAEQDSLRSQ